ncbi:MAG: ATP-binding protein [Planctomycetota bacterium]|jgi:PAS domain S-box-containing protein
MKITHKLTLATALPVTLIWGVAFYAAAASQDSLRQAIEGTSAERASAILDEINRVMHTRIAEWRAYAHSPLVQRTLHDSNLEFEVLKDRQRHIDDQDRAWRAATEETPTPLMEHLMSNELARAMRIRLDMLARENGFSVVGEVFVTNRYGANVAQTNRTSDYRQDDEDWWILANRDGLYVGDVGFDESADVFSTDLCIRIDDDGGTPLGVLKAVLNIQEVINIVDTRASTHNTGRIARLVLFTKDKRIIRCSGETPDAFLSDGSRYFSNLTFVAQDDVFTTERFDEVEGRAHLSVYATSQGFGGFQGLGWILLLEHSADTILRPVGALRTNILLIAAGATLLALGFGGTVAVPLSRRIGRLADANVALGRGDLDTTVSVWGADELAQLGSSFNRMARDLRGTTQGLQEQTRTVEHKNRLLEQEIVERKRAEEQLHKAHAETRLLLDSITSILISIDDCDRITACNSRAGQVFGVTAKEVIGQFLPACEFEWDTAVVARSISECRTTNEPTRPADVSFTCADGTDGFLAITVNPLKTDGNKQSGVLLVAVDITEQKVLQSQLGEAQKLESIGQLAAGIAHEINTPTQYVGDNTRFLRDSVQDLIKIIDQYAELLAPNKEPRSWDEQTTEIRVLLEELDIDFLREEIPKAIEQSLEGVERVATIVRSMKEFSHPGGHEKQMADLNRAIESTVTVARNEWKYVAEMVTDLESSLPLVPCLLGDFNQVILNMIVNAAHAITDVVGKNSGEKGTISVSTRQEGVWAEIRVSDTGTGIPESVRSRIFDPFFTTKDVGKGSGQGLSIARTTVVKKHGGELRVESEVGQGTTFIIRLPIEAGPGPNAGTECHEEAYSLR